jgi:predicted HTH domain antitoxin
MQLTIPYPDSLPDALRTPRQEFERQARLLLALRLFELGRVTSGQAAIMAGTKRVEFLLEAGRNHIESMMPDPSELSMDADDS